MSKGNDPAYPSEIETRRYLTPDMFTVDKLYSGGLTKRELFAAMAMQGLIQHAATIDTGGRPVAEFVCEAARIYADALLAALEAKA